MKLTVSLALTDAEFAGLQANKQTTLNLQTDKKSTDTYPTARCVRSSTSPVHTRTPAQHETWTLKQKETHKAKDSCENNDNEI